MFTACDKYEKSEAVYDIHEDCIEHLYFEAKVLQFKSDAIFDDKWIEDNFIESYITIEEDNDFEICIHLKQNTDIVNQDKWFYIQVLGDELVEAKEADWLSRFNVMVDWSNWLYTDKIDKAWEKK